MDTLRIGVTGHRILHSKQELAGSIQKVMDTIDLAFPARSWIVYSSLAEGSDCLFVQFALQRPAVKLYVPLPFPVQEYLVDFHSSESRSVFEILYNQASDRIVLPAQASREEAFRSAGEYIVDHADILVAIWDGKKEQGIGGTGYVVALARSRNLPIARIAAGNRRTGTLSPTHLGKQQGEVTVERFPPAPPDRRGRT
jgi:hypothetical protein